MPIEITPAPASASAQPTPVTGGRRLNLEIRFGARKISVRQRITFTERLTLLLETGVSLHEALGAMRLQADDPEQTRILASLTATISEGKSFSQALSGHPEMFPGTYVNLVAAAEGGGFLPQILKQLLKMDEKNDEMRSNLTAALSYPLMLIAFSIMVVVFVLVVIFPKFEALFASIHDQLPVTTLALMAASAAVRHYWPLLLIGIGAAVWLSHRWLSSAAGKIRLDRFKMTAPLIRDIYARIYLSQTLSVLGLSLASGVPITVALKASQGVIDNALFSAFLDSLRQHVNEGRGIAAGFAASPLVPQMVRQMITTGEQTGNLGIVMTRVADYYERELAKRITVLSKSVEPVMLVVMGVVVGLIVVSLILPIFKLSRAIH